MIDASGTSTFHFHASTATGALERGTLPAASREAAAEILVARGLWPIEITATERRDRGALWSALGAPKRRRMPVAQLALGLRILADFLESGLPLTRALSALHELAPPAWRAALPGVRDAIREGKSLAGALASAPVEFPAVVLGMISAGEAGSGLAAAVRRSAEIVEEAATTRSAIRTALAYPITLAVAGAGAVALLVGVVLPRFASILEDLGQSLPPSTRLLLALGAFARSAVGPMLVLAMLAVLALRAWTAAPSGRRAWHALLLRVPIIGRTRRAAAVSRSCAALGALLESAVPVAPALMHAAHAAGDAAVEARLQAARELVIRGERLSKALADHDAATPTAMRLVRAGEDSGRLASMLTHASRLERERALHATRTAVRVLEPMLVLLFGVVVAFVAAALLQALYSVRPPA